MAIHSLTFHFIVIVKFVKHAHTTKHFYEWEELSSKGQKLPLCWILSFIKMNRHEWEHAWLLRVNSPTHWHDTWLRITTFNWFLITQARNFPFLLARKVCEYNRTHTHGMKILWMKMTSVGAKWKNNKKKCSALMSATTRLELFVNKICGRSLKLWQ